MNDVLIPMELDIGLEDTELVIDISSNSSEILVSSSDQQATELPVEQTSDQSYFTIDTISTSTVVPIEVTNVIGIVDDDPYPGPYTVTPNETVQILQTNGYYMEDNVTVYAVEVMTNAAIREAVAAGWR